MAVFRLSKWYLDLCTPDGDVAIAYTGRAEWGPIRLNYSSFMDGAGTRYSLAPQAEPLVDAASVTWQSPGLGIEGQWTSSAASLRETIFSSDAGSVEWECLVPCGAARIGDRNGLGYAEKLTMTIAPWKLPIQRLRWGRFTSESDWIVWIDWQGPHERCVLYRNGLLSPATLLDDRGIRFKDGARLTLDQAMVLRQGPLGSTALAVIPGIRETFPARLLAVHECKWRSRGVLQQPGFPSVEGWAIHEKVEWPRLSE